MTNTTTATREHYSAAQLGVAAATSPELFDCVAVTLTLDDPAKPGAAITHTGTAFHTGTDVRVVLATGQDFYGNADLLVASPMFNNGYAHGVRSLTVTERREPMDTADLLA